MTASEIRAYLLAREALRKLHATTASAPSSGEEGDDAPDSEPPGGS
jgi:hypothetical protein